MGTSDDEEGLKECLERRTGALGSPCLKALKQEYDWVRVTFENGHLGSCGRTILMR